ncbi:hypothetical protein ACGFY8_20925 [Streptomyces sp. NPDC048232]|uniref:hypothetical protein n=1 Tax=Streptomyces sp. NPDC048232 TaxID=3365520 RepID=UPI00371538F7
MDLTLLVEEVGRHLAAGNRHPAHACSAMRRLVRSSALTAHVRSALGSSKEIRRMSEKSQVHPNAFDKVTLFQTSLGVKLVLHRWLAADDAADDSIHNHRWDFCSAVLGGMLLCEEYVERPDGTVRAYAHEYRSPGDTAEYSLTSLGGSRVALVGRITHGVGAVYHQAHDVLHRARVSSSGALTLIVQGPVLADSTAVHSSSLRPAAHRVLRREPGEVAHALTDLLHTLPVPPGS